MRKYYIFNFLVLLLFKLNLSYSQDVQSATLKYTPVDSGYELNIPFKWKFINCYGEVHVTITKNSKNITSNVYIYNGKRYTQNELGAAAFTKPECGLTDIQVDFYNDAYRLGQAKLDNVIDWLGGCFGQTYHITKLVGVNDADYRKKLANLSLKNIRFLGVYSKDHSIESKIKELEKNKSLKRKIKEADDAFNLNDYQKAKALYEEALKIEYNNEYVKNKLKQIKEKFKTEKQKLALENQLDEAKTLFEKGDYESAKKAYEKALKIDANNSETKNKLKTINEKLKEEKEKKEEAQRNTEAEKAQRKKKETAISKASNRRHNGIIWGQDHKGKYAQSGSSFQETDLIGLFKVEYDIWSLSGEPAHKFKFYWEWDNALNTNYPQYVSVLKDKVIQIADFAKYPDLLKKWNNIKPLYVELKCDILYFKNNEDYVAHKGTIKIIPEIIGKSGEDVKWSPPASPKWNELFTYTNNMDWDYFRDLGIYNEVDEYADEFSTDIAWPKYAFEYSNDINFFQSHNYIDSNYITLSNNDYENYSTSIYISKAIWPEEEMMTLIEEFQILEKRAKEEKMEAKDFWNSSENDKKNKNTSFWDTPDNTKTVDDVKREEFQTRDLTTLNELKSLVSNQRRKYEMLKNPFKITSHKTNSTIEEGKINFKGQLHPFLVETGKVSISIKDESFRTSTDSGNFSSNIILSEGWNDIELKINADGFGFKETVKIFYKKPPPLPCDELVTGGSGYQIKEHGIGAESGTFTMYWDLFTAYDEFSIYAAPKERISNSNRIFSHSGYRTGSKTLTVKDLEGGVITIVFNGDGGGSGWKYNLECPNK